MVDTQKIRQTIYELVDTVHHAKIADIEKAVVRKLGLKERAIQYAHVEVRNTIYESRFKKVPFEERMLFIPHCMKNLKKCKGKHRPDGFECAKCGACQIGKIIEMGEEAGYKRIAVVPGGSLVFKEVIKWKPKAILGIACYGDIMSAFDKIKITNLPTQAVLLLKDGCIDTFANLKEVEEKIFLIDESLIPKNVTEKNKSKKTKKKKKKSK